MIDRKDATVIIKRAKKVSRGTSSNASWKVAFGDFNLSMMSVFLVLWILSMSPLDEREAISRYFLNPGGIFEEAGSPYPVDLGQGSSGQSSSEVMENQIQYMEAREESPLWGLFQTLREAGLSEIMETFRGNLELHYLPEGVRIIIEEDDGRHMFNRGGRIMTPYFEDLMLNLAPYLARAERAISIVGHSDATPFNETADKDNWDLSSVRANEARRVLVYGGFPDDKIMQVSAMADQLPLDPDNPSASRNRRVEIMVMTEESEMMFDNLLGANRDRRRAGMSETELAKARVRAEANQRTGV